MISRLVRVLVVAAAALGFGSTASAATYYLNYANTFDTVQTYATVEVDELANGNVRFTVTLAPFLASSGQGFDSFGFNIDGTTPVLTTSNIVNSSAPAWDLGTSDQMDGFGTYDYRYYGGGASEREPSPLTFEIAVSSDNAETYYALANGSTTSYFSAHIVDLPGYDPYGGATFYIGGGPEDDYRPPVPLPASVWLLGSALLGLAGISRRRRAA